MEHFFYHEAPWNLNLFKNSSETVKNCKHLAMDVLTKSYVSNATTPKVNLIWPDRPFNIKKAKICIHTFLENVFLFYRISLLEESLAFIGVRILYLS